VNLTLTEMEERFVDSIIEAGANYETVMRHLTEQAEALGVRVGPPLGLADIVHVLLRLGMNQLDYDLAEISYAAEAAADDAEDRAISAALQRRLLASTLRDEQ
jgi:hypothetical protein